jgi:lipopolysaccharide transport system permease protein
MMSVKTGHLLPSASVDETVIRPSSGWQAVRIGEIWRYRELLLTLALKDVRVRYKQTILGAAWAVVQPLAQMVAFTVIFAARGFPTDGGPAPVFYFSGLLAWQLFAGASAAAANSLVANRGLITKVYFPRLIIPLASIATALVDFAISFGVLLVIMLIYRVAPSGNIVLLPLFVLLAVAATLSVGVWLSALNVAFRDVQQLVPFLIQFWLFVTPVIYPSSAVHGFKQVLLGLNPMTGVVEGMRWCLLGRPAPGAVLGYSIVSTIVLLLSGLMFFRRTERTFADQL